MLQGFYWDSYTDTKWANLVSQAANAFILMSPGAPLAAGSPTLKP